VFFCDAVLASSSHLLQAVLEVEVLEKFKAKLLTLQSLSNTTNMMRTLRCILLDSKFLNTRQRKKNYLKDKKKCFRYLSNAQPSCKYCSSIGVHCFYSNSCLCQISCSVSKGLQFKLIFTSQLK